MSKLALFGRPYIVFDANNKDHRRWFAEFNSTRTWAQCPVRFVIDDDQGDLITMIQRRLIQYYVDREFVVKLPQDQQPASVVKKLHKNKLTGNR